MRSINCKGKILTLDIPRVMGIVNCTPDSIYNNIGRQQVEQIMAFVEKMVIEGVDIIDVGGFSTRPEAQFISEEEEMKRIIPVIEKINQKFPAIPISVDTFRKNVALEAIKAGASIVNDVSGGIEPEIFSVCAENQVPYILMHIKGAPTKMMENTHYDNLITDIYTYFSTKINLIQQAGVNDVVIDLGFGFSKTLDQNYALFNQMEYFHTLDKPILVGISRKSMIKNLLNVSGEDALNGTSVLNTIALTQGVNFLRVHDVKEAVELRKIVMKLDKVC